MELKKKYVFFGKWQSGECEIAKKKNTRTISKSDENGLWKWIKCDDAIQSVGSSAVNWFSRNAFAF